MSNFRMIDDMFSVKTQRAIAKFSTGLAAAAIIMSMYGIFDFSFNRPIFVDFLKIGHFFVLGLGLSAAWMWRKRI